MMLLDRRIKLPNSRYRVAQIVEKRKHLYEVKHENGRIDKFPGVTGILSVIAKPALIPWATKMGVESMANALMNHKDSKAEITEEWIESITREAKAKPEKVKDEAADLGTQAHAWFEGFICGKDVPVNPKIESAVNAFKKWITESKLSLIGGDTKVASIKYGYGGALDALAFDEDEQFILLDWKTSSGIYDEYALQTSAYTQAFEETYGITCQKAIIVRFSKVEPIEFEVKEVLNLKKSLNGFLLAKQLQENLKEHHFL